MKLTVSLHSNGTTIIFQTRLQKSLKAESTHLNSNIRKRIEQRLGTWGHGAKSSTKSLKVPQGGQQQILKLVILKAARLPTPTLKTLCLAMQPHKDPKEFEAQKVHES